MSKFLDSIKLDTLVRFDVIEFAKGLLSRGWIINCQTKKITCHHAIDPNRKWCYTNPDPDRTCDIYREIFQQCNFVPTACLDCWKVVVKLNTVEELFKLLEWQYEFVKGFESKDRFCKCGIEERKYVTYPYGGYFYCNSKTDGLKRYRQVRDAMDKINPDIVVILKRYCTEFEIKLGPTKEYDQPPLAKAMEKKIYAAVDRVKGNPKQPKYLLEHVFRQWLEFAYDRGDKTCLRFNDGKPFYTGCQTYHDAARPAMKVVK